MIRFFTTILVLIFVPPALGAGLLDRKDAFTIDYGVYAGGFHALTLQTEYRTAPDAYGLVLRAQPYGVIGKLLPWAGEFTSTGHVSAGRLVPDSHTKHSRWAEDNDQDDFTYQDGILIRQQRVTLDKGQETKQDIPLSPTLHHDSVDILTATLQMLGDAAGHKDMACGFATEIYDGKRRFRLQFKDKGTEILNKSDYNIYAGQAEMCEVEMIPLEGFGAKKRGYYKIQEDARAAGQLPRVWLAPLWADGPVLPVRMLVKSEYGAVLAHVQRVTH